LTLQSQQQTHALEFAKTEIVEVKKELEERIQALNTAKAEIAQLNGKL
jgi:hypothetical protein